jgi:hypothetical protein
MSGTQKLQKIPLAKFPMFVIELRGKNDKYYPGNLPNLGTNPCP